MHSATYAARGFVVRVLHGALRPLASGRVLLCSFVLAALDGPAGDSAGSVRRAAVDAASLDELR